MAVHKAEAKWTGTLQEGVGNVKFASGSFDGQFNFTSRFGDGEDAKTSPEEMIAAANAACFSMQLNNELTKADFPPEYIQTTATARVGKDAEGRIAITQIDFVVDAVVPNVDEAMFMELAEAAKDGCIISRALAGVVEFTMEVSLKTS